MKVVGSLIIIILFSIFISCHQQHSRISDEDLARMKEPLIKVNKLLVDKDDDIIKDYLRRRKWDMQQTQTGLWFMIYSQGTGLKAVKGKTITLKYKLELLNGNLCYTSDSLGLKRFLIGQGGVESGLEEGVLLLKKGDKARFILPPHLAYGLPGDGNRVPRRAIILYEVEVLNISD